MSPTITFAILGALLVLVVAFVLLRPLLRESPRMVLGVALAFSLAAVALYRIVGTPAALDAQANVAMPQTMDDAIRELQAALAKVAEHGGAPVGEPIDVGDMGIAAYFTDTEGNLMGLWQTKSPA